MSNIIQIKRSTGTSIPASLDEGEMAYSELSDKLFVGVSSAGIDTIGGKSFTDKVDGIESGADQTDATNVNAAGAVMGTDFNAQTILLAVTDDTPSPLVITASTFVGRKASGNAGILSAAEARTILNVVDGANNYSHPNHTGEVTSTGDGAQVLAKTAITNKTAVAAVSGDFVLYSDTSDTGNLKKLDMINILNTSVTLGTDTSGNYVESITGTTNEIEITGGTPAEGGTPQIGLPDNVTIGSDLEVTDTLSVGQATAPLPIKATTPTYFKGKTPQAEILTGAGTGTYEELIVIRHAANDATAVLRRLGLLFKHSNETDDAQSDKYTGIISQTSIANAADPELILIVEDVEVAKFTDTTMVMAQHITGTIDSADGWTNGRTLGNSGGDISGTSGSWDGTGNVTITQTISNDAVTYAKMQNVAANSVLLGNVSGTNQIVAELSKASVLSLLNVADGAEVNPAVVPQAEAETGTATTERIWTAQRVSQAIAALESVTSVHTRSGVVTAAASDYDASQIDNDSSVSGAFVDDALNTLYTNKAPKASPTFTGTVTLPTSSPSGDLEAASKGYVDSVAQGLDPKDSCIAATTANITLSGTQTVDTVVLAIDDRVLVKDQSTGSQNGLYQVQAGSWVRTSDADADAEVTQGLYTHIVEGSANTKKGFILTTSDPITVGTTALNFALFSDATAAPVDSVDGNAGNGPFTGVVTLDTDDFNDTSNTNKFTTASEITKLSNIATGAEVNPALISQGEAEGGSDTNERVVSGLRMRQAIIVAPIDGGTF